MLGWKQCAISLALTPIKPSGEYTFPFEHILHSEISSNPLCKRKCYFTMDFRKVQWHDCHIIVLVNVALPLSYASYIATRLIETLWTLHSTIIYTYVCSMPALNVERSENRAIKRGNEEFVLVVFKLLDYI